MATYQQRPSSLVGRAREVAELERALDRLAAGGRCVLQLVGEPGIGKSRLAAELAGQAEQRGFLVLDGRAAEFERDLPFGLVVDALNDYLGALGPSFMRALGDATVAELAWIFPSLSRFADAAAAARAGAERHRAHYAIRAALERVAAEQPVVVLLDDVHWADPASVELLGHLVRRFNGALLAAFAFRRAPPQLVTALDAAEHSDLAIRLELAPLTPEEADSLLDPRLDAGRRAALYRESGGNPFYLEELDRAASRPGSRRRAWTVVSEREPSGPAPPGVVTAIRNEVSSLPELARVVLDSAAVAGESFELDHVAAISGQSEAAALLALDELLAADLVRPTAAPRRFRFRHPIVRRTVYETMPGGSRLGAHARAATALEAAGGFLAARAHHVERSAAVGDEAAIALLEEAARSVALRAPLTAGRWLAAAVRLLPESAARERRLALLIEASATLGQAGASEEAIAFVEQALPLVARGETEERARLVVHVAAAKRQSGHPLGAGSALGQRSPPSMIRPRRGAGVAVEAVLGRRLLRRRLRRDRGARARAARVPARQQGNTLLTGLAASLASIAATSRGDVAGGMTAFEEAWGAFEALTDEQLAAGIDLCGWLGLAATWLERGECALAATRRGLAVSRAIGQGAGLAGLLGLEAQALLMKGRAGDALQVAETAVDAALLSGNDQLLMWALQTSATASTWAGALDRAVFSAREAVALAGRTQEGFLAPLAHLVLAGALLAAGDAAEARRELDRLDAEPAATLLDLSAGRGWELLALTHLELGDVDAADDVVARAHARAKSGTCRCAPPRWSARPPRCSWREAKPRARQRQPATQRAARMPPTTPCSPLARERWKVARSPRTATRGGRSRRSSMRWVRCGTAAHAAKSTPSHGSSAASAGGSGRRLAPPPKGSAASARASARSPTRSPRERPTGRWPKRSS